MARVRFDGWIAGVGTAGGTRLVLGHWPRSPFGPVSDVMAERPDGTRVLLAPTRAVADFIADTYTFDEVRVVPVDVSRDGPQWSVRAGPLRLAFRAGRRGALGLLLRAVPPFLAGRPWWVGAVDLPARLLLRGVRTRGSAGNGRREWYGARDLRRIDAATASWEGRALGSLTGIDPPVRFGFGSTPAFAALVRVTTTVEVP
ncbi:hypothetical protein Val02_59040 [Virgisporangium aliadipatigenens]|uniref:Uncharacterized protein n=1 Tax=Virgisporangium aliadipatigenens TaxID=741659 RepID=A0A8J4DTI1_9ACTN|nr:hypothetical protein [Virgisporangium aliadipatigenens]GIJ49018.1 hypothetical protein Val02_59040 [Virgisporangium aliadipatigenens]